MKYKKAVSLSLAVIFIFVSLSPVCAGSNGYTLGYIRGQQHAREDGGGQGWMLAGGCSTFFLGLIGGGITLAISATMEPTIPPVRLRGVESREMEYQLGYREGYREEAKNTNIKNTLGGVGIGLVTLLIFVYSSY